VHLDFVLLSIVDHDTIGQSTEQSGRKRFWAAVYMSILEEQAERAIARLITEFCCRVDSGAGDQVSALFLPDATVVTPHFKLAGREAIHRWFSERATGGKRVSRHFWTNLRVTELVAGRYVAVANSMTLVGGPPAPCAGARIAAGQSTDEILIRDGLALFASRTLDVQFEGAIASPGPTP
jgi:hypothetical protein